MKHADALLTWTPSARKHNELVSGKLPLQPMERERDPWMTPAIIVCAVVVVYFIVQFLRGWL